MIHKYHYDIIEGISLFFNVSKLYPCLFLVHYFSFNCDHFPLLPGCLHTKYNIVLMVGTLIFLYHSTISKYNKNIFIVQRLRKCKSGIRGEENVSVDEIIIVYILNKNNSNTIIIIHIIRILLFNNNLYTLSM